MFAPNRRGSRKGLLTSESVGVPYCFVNQVLYDNCNHPARGDNKLCNSWGCLQEKEHVEQEVEIK